MSKTLDGVEYKRVGKKYRQMNRIKCTACGAVTYADGPKKTEDYMARTCNFCDTLKTANRRGLTDVILQRERDRERKKRFSNGEDNRQKTHGHSQTRLYQVWKNMMHRCYDEYSNNYKYYGGVGIKVCDRWTDFTNFYEDLGEIPDGLEIDRKDNFKGYEPGNIQWSSRAEQNKHKRFHQSN